MFGMITLREEKLRMDPDIFVEKRDGRRVQFDVEKIYKALLKATEEVTSLTPVMEAKLEAIVDRVIAEILERFPNGVKIYEIQNVVEHELLQAMNMRLLRATLLIGRSGILSAQKRRISTLRLENSLIRTKRLSMKMPIKTAMFSIPSVI